MRILIIFDVYLPLTRGVSIAIQPMQLQAILGLSDYLGQGSGFIHIPLPFVAHGAGIDLARRRAGRTSGPSGGGW